jgi:hypothetical protein
MRVYSCVCSLDIFLRRRRRLEHPGYDITLVPYPPPLADALLLATFTRPPSTPLASWPLLQCPQLVDTASASCTSNPFHDLSVPPAAPYSASVFSSIRPEVCRHRIYGQYSSLLPSILIELIPFRFVTTQARLHVFSYMSLTVINSRCSTNIVSQ